MHSQHLLLSDADIERLFDEDVRYGDLTTRALGIGADPGVMQFFARQDMAVSGLEETARLMARLDVTITASCTTGEWVTQGTKLLTAEGSAAALHMAWKMSQNLMEWASGIATATRGIVIAASGSGRHVPVLCTRKSVPFTRQLALKSVLAGGGEIHRIGLSDTILLFPEHRVFLAQPLDLAAAVARMRALVPERAVMVEVISEADALHAAQAFADVIQLEKFSPASVRNVVASIRKRADGRPVIAAAGGVNSVNAADYVQAGADALITSAPFQAPPCDIQVRIDKATNAK